ncbi:MAG: hypothetical protein ABI883_00085 [Chthoniobacterales bacterium]
METPPKSKSLRMLPFVAQRAEGQAARRKLQAEIAARASRSDEP